MPRMIRVFLADDHPVVREGLKRILATTEDIQLVGEAAEGERILRELPRADWDVLLLDLSLPGVSGMEVLRQVRALRPEIHILVLSIHPEDQYALRVLKAGASGYLTKDSAPQTLLHAIRRVYQGHRFVSEKLAEELVGWLAEPARQSPHERLSDREFEIFLRLARGQRMVEIARDLRLSVKTVGTYRSRIFQKMGFASNAELVRYAVEQGFVS